MKLCLILACCIFFQLRNSSAQTSHYLGDRISIDGFIEEYDPGEWILDQSTSIPEVQGDSRWGGENDVRRMGITWDDDNIYIALDCSNLDTYVAILIDLGCGGVADLREFTLFRRNVELMDFSSNLIVLVPPNLGECIAMAGGCDYKWRTLDEGGFQCAARTLGGGGAVEVAINWREMGDFAKGPGGVVLPEAELSLGILAFITGSPGTGCGDAAPDPSLILQNDSTALAVLDNHVSIPLDSDGDGMLDVGIEPRSVAEFYLPYGSSVERIPPLNVVLESKAFTPQSGEKLRFRAVFETPLANTVSLDASVYSADGRHVRVLYTGKPMSPSSSAVWYEWDGSDSHGEIVEGGIYILVVDASLGGTRAQVTARAAFAVIR